MRMIGALGAGVTPDGQEADDALEAANGLILGLPSVGSALDLREVIISGPYTAGEDERIVNPSDFAVTLPATLQDGGGVRTPRNGARVVDVRSTGAVTSIYLSSSGWERVSGLGLKDTAPLGPEHYTGLCALLAVHLAPDHDQTPNDTVVALATAGQLAIAAQFWRDVPVGAPLEYVARSEMGLPGDSADWI